jgi:hypothetical protein
MNHFLLGVTTALAATIALFFLKFWRETRDRLFIFFSAAFLILAADWLALAFITLERERQHLLFEVRLLAFGLIIAGIVDKNRSRK